MSDQWGAPGSGETPRDDRTVLIPAQGDTPPPPPGPPPGPPSGPPPGPPPAARTVLPWVVAGLALLFAAVVGFLALAGDDYDGGDLATSSEAGDETTTTTGEGKGQSSAGGDTTPVEKPGNTGTTGTSSTTTSSDTTTSTSTSTTTTTAPTTPTTLNFSLPAVYGSTALTSGFVPDPFSVGVTAGGPADVSYLAGGCTGFTTSAPSFSVNYTAGAFPPLRFYFVGSGDTTMIINTPGGSYRCADDSFGTVHPTVDFNSPASGRYDIWVATYAPNGTDPGTLYITENTGNHP